MTYSFDQRRVAALVMTCLSSLCASIFAGDQASRDESPLTEADLAHWAFRPLADPPPPPVQNAAWVRQPIDRFVLARLESRGLAPQPQANRSTLLRRLSFDLRGLPPSPEELREFLTDASPDAYSRVVERFLASVEYGERWAQHWLDLARFAESDGFEHDKARPNAWKYRDWVIDALNRDLPYDEFARQQIAGDELHPEDPTALIATGFSLCGPDMPDINSQHERRHMVLNDVTATVGSVFLGLQFKCAECHDHKWDPVSQADFYRLRSFFENTVLFRDHPLPTARSNAKGRVLMETDAKLEACHLRERGDFARLGPRVEPAFPRVANPEGYDLRPGRYRTSSTSGLRSQLADWLTRPEHALATRVIANRLWQHHFGRGIVATPSDFGKKGGRPSHPDLLDWLARELPRRDWSLKRMHRLIVTSATYRQRGALPSGETDAARELDPAARLLWKYPRRRLEAETIRDALLEVSGLRSYQRGGPGVMPPLPEEVRKSIRKNHWKVSPDPENHHRKSIYLFVRRNLRYPFFEVFDRPDTGASCARRSRTTIAPQSLALLNSDLSMRTARHFAGRVIEEAECSNDASIVRAAYRCAFGRAPEEFEIDTARAFLERAEEEYRARDPSSKLPTPLPRKVLQVAEMAPARAAAITSYCLALINLNEFIYID